MALVYVLLVAHFVADFVCQTDWMALNKSKRWDALGVHVLVYSAVLAAVVAPFIDLATLGGFGLFMAVNAVAHFVQDALTSRLTSRLWGANQRHWFFVAIGFDQLLHYVTLFVTAGWWLHG